MEDASLHYGNLYENDRYVRLRYAQYIKLLSPKIKGKVKILDIGCYNGSLTDLLPKTVEYLGIDFDESALKIAESKGLKVIKFNLHNVELILKDKFDIIVVAEVLEHLLNPGKLMEQVKNLLGNDGVVLISVPNENTLYHRLMSVLGFGIDLYPFQLYKHLHFSTIQQNIEFVSKHFKILKKEYYVNPSGKGSRFEKLGILFKLIPDFVWGKLAYLFPGCFARGIIILCAKY